MRFQPGSEWNEENEIRCLIIFKKLEAEGFPRGRQMELAREMARTSNLDATNISAKVTNFKSEAGVNRPSNSSSNTRETYRQYGAMTIEELERLL